MPVEFNVTVKLDLNEMSQTMDAEQISATLEGVAQVLSANPYADEHAALLATPATTEDK